MNRKDDCEIINSAVEEQFNEFHFKKTTDSFEWQWQPSPFKLYNVPTIKKILWEYSARNCVARIALKTIG